jgi:hypothetical protein
MLGGDSDGRVCRDQARLVGRHDGLDTVAEAQLLEDVRDVCVLTVVSLMYSSSPISAMDSPPAVSTRMLTSGSPSTEGGR